MFNGIALHPVTWTLFVVWSRLVKYMAGETPRGDWGSDLYGAFIWSAGSIMYGFLLTVPAMALAAVAYTRMQTGPTHTPQ
jgi:hypothetical protein